MVILLVSENQATSLVNFSNALYITGAVLALISTGLVIVRARQLAAGGRQSGAAKSAEIVAVIGAILAITGSFGAIYFGIALNKIKDMDFNFYKEGVSEKLSADDVHIKDLQVQLAQADDDKAKSALELQRLNDAEQHTSQQVISEGAIQRGRRLSPAAENAISAYLSKHALPALLSTHSADREAEHLCNQLLAIFSAQKDIPQGLITSRNLFGGPVYPSGVSLLYRSNPLGYKDEVEALSDILNRYGIKTSVMPMAPNDWKPGIEVLVGSDPKTE